MRFFSNNQGPTGDAPRQAAPLERGPGANRPGHRSEFPETCVDDHQAVTMGRPPEARNALSFGRAAWVRRTSYLAA